MLTKEQCSDALCDLYNRIYGEDYSYEKEFDVLSDLIDEHFSNPPLLFDEIKTKEPVFDNEEFGRILIKYKYPYKQFLEFASIDGDTGWVEYKENRFYKKKTLSVVV